MKKYLLALSIALAPALTAHAGEMLPAIPGTENFVPTPPKSLPAIPGSENWVAKEPVLPALDEVDLAFNKKDAAIIHAYAKAHPLTKADRAELDKLSK